MGHDAHVHPGAAVLPELRGDAAGEQPGAVVEGEPDGHPELPGDLEQSALGGLPGVLRLRSEYLGQLREKQKARRIYGVLERQMKNTFDRAAEVTGATGETLLINLETRLDNTVYRSGFAKSRSQARQLVTHGHITVNGRETKTPSFTVKAGDAIAVTEKSRGSNYFKEMTAWAKTQTRPGWLEVDPDAYTAKVLAAPSRDQIEAQVNTQLIVEHYSR